MTLQLSGNLDYLQNYTLKQYETPKSSHSYTTQFLKLK
jgi:hypothetical protein